MTRKMTAYVIVRSRDQQVMGLITVYTLELALAAARRRCGDDEYEGVPWK